MNTAAGGNKQPAAKNQLFKFVNSESVECETHNV